MLITLRVERVNEMLFKIDGSPAKQNNKNTTLEKPAR